MQGIGMIAVGAVAVTFWRLKKHVGLEYYVYGAVLWAIAIAIKLAMDFTITKPIASALSSALPAIIVVAALSLYFGLRTGILESGITYMAVKKTKLSTSTFDEAIALGIGFGGMEAVILGAYGLLLTFQLLWSYQTLGLLSPISLDSQALYNIILPTVERAAALVCHVFATVLVVYAVKLRERRWLYASIAFKTIIDGALLPFQSLSVYTGIDKYWPLDVFLIILACISLAGLYRIKKIDVRTCTVRST